MRIGRRFFQRDPVVCARELVGCRLQWGQLSGVVVETEAYDGADDEACHTWFRPRARAFVAEHSAGAAYVYLNYGMHWMLNVLVKGKRQGFVLIRALEPLDGIEAMREARGVQEIAQLCSGPGKLTRALVVNGSHHGMDLCADPAFGFHRRHKVEVSASPRIGISRAVDLPWRFFVPGNPHVSGKKKKTDRG
jgi:DNA-3-methyladenine glycosylase